MNTNLFFAVIFSMLISGCCSKVDDCNCQSDPGLICHFNYPDSHHNIKIIALNKDGKTKIDSILLSSNNQFTFNLRATDFINNEVSLTESILVFNESNTQKTDTLHHFSFAADTITNKCNECWIRKADKITCTVIHSYELLFNKQIINSNKITLGKN